MKCKANDRTQSLHSVDDQEMVSNKLGNWLFLRLLVALLFLHAAHCQKGDTRPSCRSRGGDLNCRQVTSFAFITSLLPTQPPGVAVFTLADSPDVQLTGTDFNHQAFQNTAAMYLLRCNLSTINPEHFTSLPRLTILTIKSNNLTEISSSSFLGLERLERVYLDDNQIASVAADTFTNLHHLTTIDLSKNKIGALADSMFVNQRKLTELVLVQNKITVLNDNTFKGLVRLSVLDLNNNMIESISPGAFTESSQLIRLYLGYNNLQSLPPTLFQTNTRLQYLHLSGNNLANLANYPLNIPSLQQLHLNDGKIQSIPVDYFANLKNVNSLSLTYNELSRFEDVLLEGLPELEYLDLDSNKFTSFNMTAFRALNPTFAAKARRGGITVEGNPWDCSDPVGEVMVDLCLGSGFVDWM